MATAGNDEKSGRSGTPRKAPMKAAGAAAKRGTASSAARKAGAPAGNGADELRSALRLFASARPAGWDHRDWLNFLDELQSSGHDTSDSDGIGRLLEQERLSVVLQQVPGLGPRRVNSLVTRFETLWSMRHAGADEIAAVPGMNRPLAEKVRQELQR